MRGIDRGQLAEASRNLGDAALDPALWPEVMETICRATGTTGAVLLQTDVRTPDVPRAAGVHEMLTTYFPRAGTPATSEICRNLPRR